MKLRASGKKVTVPSPPPALRMGGDATPVNIRRPFYDGVTSPVMYSAPPSNNIGKYTPPPKQAPWVVIPLGIRPTPYRNVIVR